MTRKFCISIDVLLLPNSACRWEIFKLRGKIFQRIRQIFHLPSSPPNRWILLSIPKRAQMDSLITPYNKRRIIPLVSFNQYDFCFFKKVKLKFFIGWFFFFWLVKFKGREGRNCLSISSTSWGRVRCLVVIFTCVTCDSGTVDSVAICRSRQIYKSVQWAPVPIAHHV